MTSPCKPLLWRSMCNWRVALKPKRLFWGRVGKGWTFCHRITAVTVPIRVIYFPPFICLDTQDVPIMEFVAPHHCQEVQIQLYFNISQGDDPKSIQDILGVQKRSSSSGGCSAHKVAAKPATDKAGACHHTGRTNSPFTLFSTKHWQRGCFWIPLVG